MKKIFVTLAVFIMAIYAYAQTNQYFWYGGNLMMGNPIAQIDSVTFGEGEPTDTLHILLPRTIIKTVHDTITIITHDTMYIQGTVYGDCPIEGALLGEFSISPTQKVNFSKGNLQYHCTNHIWRFAENQYDTIGRANRNISSSYAGWIDLFGWGTGDNPTKVTQNRSEYQIFNEWGANAISNGGYANNMWRTLTKDEWRYLFFSRNNASALFGIGRVNGLTGLIILPDNWSLPIGLSFMPSSVQGLVNISDSVCTCKGSSIYSSRDSCDLTANTYSAEQWIVMERSGAAFLPAAYYRVGPGIIAPSGNYWSSTQMDESHGYGIYFNIRMISSGGNGLESGFSVRLVHLVVE